MLLYAPVLKLLVWQWYNDADYSHGFLVPVLSAYLIWARRDKLRQIPRKPSVWGMVIVLFSLAVLFLGSLGAELSLARLSFVGCLCGLIVYFAGSKVLRAHGLPHRVPAVRHSHAGGGLQRDRFPAAIHRLEVRHPDAGDSEPVPDHARRAMC